MDCKFTPVGERFELGFERRLAYSPEKVWRVLTDRALLRQWFPCDIAGDWRVGEELQFIFLHGEGDGMSEEELRGEVLTVDPAQLLEFRWGEHLFRCELSADGNGCRFRFTESVIDSSLGARNAAGWEMCFDNLDLLLQGAEAAVFIYEVWQKKFEGYVKKFEPEMGPQQGAPENHPSIPADYE